jgi:hypothetical protein
MALPGAAIPRGQAFLLLGGIANINARGHMIVASVVEQGLGNALALLFGVNAVVWFVLYAGWRVATDNADPDVLRPADYAVLAAVATASLLPSPILAAFAGLAASIWFFYSAPKQSGDRALAILLLALAGQIVLGRLFLALFSELILAADVSLVSLFAPADAVGNVLLNDDGRNLIVFAGCSSVGNMSFAILAWVCSVQLFRLRLDIRVLLWAVGSLVMIFILNSVRLGMLAALPEHFDFLHHGAGAQMLGWVNLLLLAAMIGAATLGAASRQGRTTAAVSA